MARSTLGRLGLRGGRRSEEPGRDEEGRLNEEEREEARTAEEQDENEQERHLEDEEEREAEGGDEEERSARRGARAERRRIAGILRSEAARGRMATALALALDTDLPADPAGQVLAASPKDGSREAGLAARMAAESNPQVGPGGRLAAQGDGWDRIVASVNLAHGFSR